MADGLSSLCCKSFFRFLHYFRSEYFTIYEKCLRWWYLCGSHTMHSHCKWRNKRFLIMVAVEGGRASGRKCQCVQCDLSQETQEQHRQSRNAFRFIRGKLNCKWEFCGFIGKREIKQQIVCRYKKTTRKRTRTFYFLLFESKLNIFFMHLSGFVSHVLHSFPVHNELK